MNNEVTISPIAYIHTNLEGKFGLPRQSGIAEKFTGTIVFEPEYRDPNAVRGLEGFDYIWLMWQFSESVKSTEQKFSPTVRPPRLGGNERMGVFATRSPFRPNNLGLSAVRLENITMSTHDGPVLNVSGIDLMDGTPIFDIKPYVAYADSYPDASAGFLADLPDLSLNVNFPETLKTRFCELLEEAQRAETEALMTELENLLCSDPRPQYHDDPERIYGLTYAGLDIKFRVAEKEVTVTDVQKV